MTLARFLKRLAKVEVGWQLLGDRIICCSPYGNMCCPLTAVEFHQFNSCYWKEAARALRMPLALAVRIVSAADKDPGHSKILRRQLLRACGLRERAE